MCYFFLVASFNLLVAIKYIELFIIPFLLASLRIMYIITATRTSVNTFIELLKKLGGTMPILSEKRLERL